jgi:hypothetical protein
MDENLPDSVMVRIRHLRESRALHLELGGAVVTAYGGTLYPLDFLAAAVLHRSLNLVASFTTLLERRSLTSAAALLWLQVDTCLRFYAAFIVDDPHDFAMRVLAGEPVKKQKDRAGQLMSDRYLAQQLSGDVPWILPVYQHTSGYVHLSEKHIFATIQGVDNESRTIDFMISDHDVIVSEELYVEALDAFTAATELLLRHVEGWAYSKNNPDRLRHADEGSGDPPAP